MKRSVIAIILTASLLVSVCSCSRDPEPSVTETLPRVTTTTAPSASDVPGTSAPTETIFPSRDMSTMSINEVEEVLLNAAGRGEALSDYNYAIEENAGIGLIDGRTYSYNIMDENPDVFGGFNILQFDTESEAFRNMQVGDYIEVYFRFGDEIMSGQQAVTAINGPYVFSAWETPRGGGYNSTPPFTCAEIQAAYLAFSA